jgi:hypothetical protein
MSVLRENPFPCLLLNTEVEDGDPFLLLPVRAIACPSNDLFRSSVSSELWPGKTPANGRPNKQTVIRNPSLVSCVNPLFTGGVRQHVS